MLGDSAIVATKQGTLLAFWFAPAVTAQQKVAAGPFATKATVEVKSENGVIPLKREEQIAFMFVAYKVVLNGSNWEIWANPRKPGLGGFYAVGKFFGGRWYNPAGPATAASTKITESSIDGDLFMVQ